MIDGARVQAAKIAKIKTHVLDFDSGRWVKVERKGRKVPRSQQARIARAILAARPPVPPADVPF